MALTPVISSLSITHNGSAGEFTWSWDAAQGILSLGGFRRLFGTLSYVTISYSLLASPTTEVTNTLQINVYMDSNDIKDLILNYLLSAISGLQKEIVSETPASADVSGTLDLCYYNFYQHTFALTLSSDGDCPWNFLEDPTVTPTALASVSGIAAARGRLLAWDRENAIYRSAQLDQFDFIPSLATQAAVGKAQAVRGNIVHIQGMTDGYLILTTDNMIRADYSGDEYVFKYREVADYGISDPRHSAVSSTDLLVYSANGIQLYTMGTGKFTPLSPELDTYLSQYPWPLRLQYLEDRYICVGLPWLLNTDTILLANRGLSPIAEPVFTPGDIYIPNYPWNAADYPSLQRILVFDTKLERWGSCDTGAMGLFGFTPFNAAGSRMDKLDTGYEQFWDTLGTGLGVIDATARLWLASTRNSAGKLMIGGIRAQAYGWVTLLEILPEYTKGPWTPTYTVVPYDMSGAELTTMRWVGDLTTKPDVTGHRLELLIAGQFNLTGLRIATLPHGDY